MNTRELGKAVLGCLNNHPRPHKDTRLSDKELEAFVNEVIPQPLPEFLDDDKVVTKAGKKIAAHENYQGDDRPNNEPGNPIQLMSDPAEGEDDDDDDDDDEDEYVTHVKKAKGEKGDDSIEEDVVRDPDHDEDSSEEEEFSIKQMKRVARGLEPLKGFISPTSESEGILVTTKVHTHCD